jgi:hypothetical protein
MQMSMYFGGLALLLFTQTMVHPWKEENIINIS